MRRNAPALAALVTALMGISAPAQAAEPGKSPGILWGISESGMEFGKGPIAGTNYAVPDPTYYLQRGVRLVRVPFQIVRLQPVPEGPLDPAVLGYLKAIARQDAAAGAVTVLDPHAYGTYPINGKPQDILKNPAAADAYVDLMGKIAASFFAGDVAIALMNEPHTGADTDYAPVWNRAIAAIRQAGFHGVILVPHAHWSTASDITPAKPYAGVIIDPENNWVLELHCYLDPDNTGTYKKPVPSIGIGAARIAGAIAWSRLSHVRLFLGETGAPADGASLAALQTMFDAIAAAPDAFWGVALWGAGPWWNPKYPMHLDPTAGVDTPQFRTLETMITPEMLYFARDPGGPDPVIQIDIDARKPPLTATITALRNAVPQVVVIKSQLSTGVHTVVVTPLSQPSGDIYIIDSTWKGIPNSSGSFAKLTGRGYEFEIKAAN
jgi:endoglucanase